MTGGLETARVRPLMPAKTIFILQEVKETLGSPWLLLTNKGSGCHTEWVGRRGWALVQDSSPRDPKSPVKPLQITVRPRWPADLRRRAQEAQKTLMEQKAELTLLPIT